MSAAEKADRWEARFGGPGLPEIGRILRKGATEAQQNAARREFRATIDCWHSWGTTPVAVVYSLHRAVEPWLPGVYLRPHDFASKTDAEILSLRKIGAKSLAAIRAAAGAVPLPAPDHPSPRGQPQGARRLRALR
jgi:hypothetical protein